MRYLILTISALMMVAAILTGGTAPFGRLMLGLGLPSLAAPLFSDPEWRGVAQYRAGRFDAAAASFQAAGLRASYNLGNALAFKGEYAAALEAYDVALAQRQDADARANMNLVMSFYAGTQIEAGSIIEWFEDKIGESVAADIAQGNARAAGTGDGVTNTGALEGLPEVQSVGGRGVRKVYDDTFVVASDRWLATLEDVPGAFLAARILHEHKQRKKDGVGQPTADTPW